VSPQLQLIEKLHMFRQTAMQIGVKESTFEKILKAIDVSTDAQAVKYNKSFETLLSQSKRYQDLKAEHPESVWKNYDLMSPRGDLPEQRKLRLYRSELREHWLIFRKELLG
jgi:hypothetical protein